MKERRDEIPERRSGESCAVYFARISEVYMDHLSGCSTCNYNQDNCNACDADLPDQEFQNINMHACNCATIEPGGLGVRLRNAYDAAFRDKQREERGE